MKKVGGLAVLVLIAALIGIFACSGSSSTSSEDVVLRMIDAVNSRDFDALDKVVALDVRRHSGATPDVTVQSLEDFKAFLHQDLAAVPDAVQEVNLIFSNGPFVAVHETYRGTQSGPMGPFPASNRRLELPFIGILRVEDGKIVEIWVEWDNLNALSQLGHFPPAAQKPEMIQEAPTTGTVSLYQAELRAVIDSIAADVMGARTDVRAWSRNEGVR